MFPKHFREFYSIARRGAVPGAVRRSEVVFPNDNFSRKAEVEEKFSEGSGEAGQSAAFSCQGGGRACILSCVFIHGELPARVRESWPCVTRSFFAPPSLAAALPGLCNSAHPTPGGGSDLHEFLWYSMAYRGGTLLLLGIFLLTCHTPSMEFNELFFRAS